MDVCLTTEDKLSASFLAARTSYPYFASGLYMLVRRIANVTSKTMMVSRRGVITVDPRFVAKYEVPQLAEVLVHELLHVLREHGDRADKIASIDRFRWNVAADCEINPNLQLEKLPSPCLPETFGMPNGLLAEEYYARLPSDLSGVIAGVASGQCGSGSGGDAEGEPVDDGSERTDDDLRRVRLSVAADVLAHNDKRPGQCSSDLLRWADGVLAPPKVRWQDVLRRCVRAKVAGAAGKVDYTFARPNRRQSCYARQANGGEGEFPVVPGMVGKRPNVAVGVDTSASMGAAELGLALSEISGVLRAIGTPAAFLACDSEVRGRSLAVRTVAEAARLCTGGGGTDFRPVMAEVERLRPRPDLFIFVTDGCGPAPKSAPPVTDVVWVLVGKYAQSPAEWGEKIFIEEKRR